VTGDSITVAVATCGRPTALERCLEALASGTTLPGEVIVVDQMPSTEARRVAEARAPLPARYLEQRRLGLSASRNLALAAASRPVLAVTDDDCTPDAEWVGAIAAVLSDGSAWGAVTGPILPLGPPPPGAHAVSLRESMQAVEHSGRVLPWTVGSGANFAARRSLLHAHGGWDQRLGAGSPGRAGEDADLLYRLLRAGEVIRYEPTAVVRHEWQTTERRLATRSSYGYGVGALCGLWLRRRDLYAARMLGAYARLHLGELARAGRHGDRALAVEHVRALASVPPGVLYGLWAEPLDPEILDYVAQTQRSTRKLDE
jgi:GT2 family glycosyltransferase